MPKFIKYYLKTIADNLVSFRGKTSQTILAKKAGVSLGTVQAIEAGKNFEIESLIKIANALGVTPNDFFVTINDRREISAKMVTLMKEAIAKLEEKPSK
jgi:transcriptional regulator with XRE-family HTH domain